MDKAANRHRIPAPDMALLHAVVEATPVGMLAVDEDGNILFVNGSLAELFGYEREDMVGLKLEALMPRRYRDIHRLQRRSYTVDPDRRPMAGGRKVSAKHRHGTEFPVYLRLAPANVQGGIGVVASVTVRQEKTDHAAVQPDEGERQDSCKRFRSLVPKSAALIAEIEDLDGYKLPQRSQLRMEKLRGHLEEAQRLMESLCDGGSEE